MYRIIQGVDHFQRKVFPRKRALFERLATGQDPETLLIGCSDSRVSVEMITQTAPGDVFVCRTAGNIVPPHGETDAVAATVEYAVTVLNIRDIIVKGHSDCGAMKGLLRPENLDQMPAVRQWLKHAEGAVRALQAQTDAGGMTPEALAKLNVRLQLEHLRTYPGVKRRLNEGTLQLHGWFYRIDSGSVETWDEVDDRWVTLQQAAPGLIAQRSAMAERGEVRHA